MKTEKSKALFERAKQVIPGGVNSPVRACNSVGGEPTFVAAGDGCYVYSADGERMIDMISSWGPLILGHTHTEVLDAIRETLSDGATFGAPTELEVRFAEAVCEAVPSVEKVRAVSSGTEATMSALRLARGVTGRDKIIKADGGYHGHADFLLVAAGSGAATLGIPGSAGVAAGTAKDTLLAPYNDTDAVAALFESNPDQIAAVIIEPVAGNMGLVPPADGYLAALRELTQKHGALLIFDEVITGFRVGYSGAQGHYGVSPDLTCLGKIIGGGMPAAAFGGRAELMDQMAPDGAVYQAGTLSGNPLAMAAGLRTLSILRRPGTYERLEELGSRLGDGLLAATRDAGINACLNRVGSAMTLFFCDGPVTDYDSAKTADTERFGRWWNGMRERGIFLAPSQFEAIFVSLAHTENEIDKLLEMAAETLKTL